MGNPDEASASGGSSPVAAPPDVVVRQEPVQPLRPEVFHISGTRLSTEPAASAAAAERPLQLPSTPPPRQASLENGSLATESSFTDRTSNDSASVQGATSPGATRSREEAAASVDAGSAAASPTDDETRRAAHGLWSHDLFSVFATFFSVFGLFTVTRFSLLVHIYKGTSRD